MRLALCQPRPTDGDTDSAFDTIERMALASSTAGADLLLLPELMLPGYNRPDLHGVQAQHSTGPWAERIADIARDNSIAIVLGFAERDGDRVYNSAIAVSKSGKTLACFRKLQLYGPMENKGFVAGESYVTFPFHGRTIGILICFDIEFPGHARALTRLGASLILVPTANPFGFAHVADLLVPARAAENGIIVAYANYAGFEGKLKFDGGSVIAGHGGAILGRAGDEPALLISTLPEPDANGEIHASAETERTGLVHRTSNPDAL